LTVTADNRDCGKGVTVDALEKSLFRLDNLSARLEPGSEVPAGERECGEQAYLVKP
jgi:hypothetical protein